MNGAAVNGDSSALLLRDLHADSDSRFDPQAYILRPDVVLRISRYLVKAEG
jgi:methanol--5-hydroxybenzimidazolylcobamide Co-methyltransferase